MERFGLLLILAAQFIQGITATSVHVNEGKLSDVTQLDALATIAGQSDGDALLEMLNGTDGSWHPMSFWRFLILGAGDVEWNKESLNLTKENELLKNVSEMGGLSATKRSAVAVHQSTHHVKEVGTVNIKAWSLVYSCISDTTDSSHCVALIPVFILHYNQSKPEFQYVNLFRGLFTGPNSPYYFATAVSADLGNLQHYDDTKDGITFRMPKNTQMCTLNSIQAARSVLGASYGIPGFVCYNTSSSSLKTVKDQRVLSNEQALDTYYDGSVKWPKVPIEECSTAPFLYGYYISGYYYSMACAPNATGTYCVMVNTSNKSECNYSATIDAMYEKLMTSPNSTTCGAQNNDVYKNSGYITVVSRWEASDGKSLEEFEEGKPTGDFCYRRLRNTQVSEPISCSETNSENSTSTRCDPTYFSEDLLRAMLKDTADSFLSGHVLQFNVKKGPYGSRLDAAALSVATFIGLVGLVGPLTRTEIKVIKSVRKWFSSKFEFKVAQNSNSRLRCVCLCVLNVGIGCIVYGPIIAAMRTQYDKRLPFHTWAMSATSETINTYGTKLLFLTFVEGTSTYFNPLIWGCYISACILALLITAICTCCNNSHAPNSAQAYRDSHNQPFHRYASMVTRK